MGITDHRGSFCFYHDDEATEYAMCFTCSEGRLDLDDDSREDSFSTRLLWQKNDFSDAVMRRNRSIPGWFKSFGTLPDMDGSSCPDWTTGGVFEDASNDKRAGTIQALSNMIHKKLLHSWNDAISIVNDNTLTSEPLDGVVKKMDCILSYLDAFETNVNPSAWLLERYVHWLANALRDHCLGHTAEHSTVAIEEFAKRVSIFFKVCKGDLPLSFLGIYDPTLSSDTFRPQMDLVTRYLMKQDAMSRREVKLKGPVVKRQAKPQYPEKKNHSKKEKSFEKRCFMPQGFLPDVNVSLDEESRNFLTNLASSLQNPEIRLNHEVSFSGSSLFKGLEFVSEYSTIAYLVLACGVVIMIHTNKGNKFLLQALLAWLSYRISHDNAEYIVEVVTNFIVWYKDELNEAFTPQMLSGDSVRESFVSLLMTIYAGRRLSKEEVGKVIADIPRTMNGMTFVWDKVISFIELCLRSINSNWSLIQMGYLSGVSPEIGELESEVDSFMRSLDKDAILSDVSIKKIADISYRLKVASRKLPSTPEFTNARSRIRDLIHLFQPIVALSERFSSKGMGIRAQPLGIMLMGPPGVGKTLSIPQIITELIAVTLSDEEFEDFSQGENLGKYFYVRDYNNEFWDNYHGQIAIHFDDFGQRVETIGGGASEAMEVFRVGNTNPMPCRMAELTDKGATWCTARIMTATTNLDRFDECTLKTVVSPDAFIRRWQVAVILVPKKEYCVNPTASLKHRRLDLTKVGEGFDINVHEFHHCDLRSGNPYGTPLSYMEFVDYCVSKYHENFRAKVVFDVANKEAILRAAARRKGKFVPQIETGYPEPDYSLFDAKMRSFLISFAESLGLDWEMVFAVATKYNLFNYEDININHEGMESFHNEFSLQKHIDPTLREKLCDGFCKFITDNKILLSTIAAFTSALCLAKAALYILNDNVSPFDSQSDDYHRQRVKAIRAARQPAPPRSRGSNGRINYNDEGYRSQMGVSSVSESLGHKILKSNGYRLLLDADLPAESGTVLFIAGRTAIMPVHFLNEIYARRDEGFYDDKFLGFKKIGSPNIIHRYKISDLEGFTFEECELYDLGFMKFPATIQSHMDIRKYFTDTLIQDVGELMFVALVKPTQNLQDVAFINSQAAFQTCPIRYDDGEVEMKGLVYNIATRNGDCGAFCMVSDARLNRPTIVGIHISGDNRSRGVCNIITKTVLNLAFQGDASEVHDDDIEYALKPQSLGANVTFIDYTPPHHMNYHSSIVKSDYYGAWSKPTCAISNLHKAVIDGEEVYVIDLARKKYGCGNKGFDEHLLGLVTSEFAAHLFNNSTTDWDNYTPREVYPYEDVIKGVPGVMFLEGIPRNTSAGYPLCLTFTSGKKDIFGHHDHYVFNTTGAKLVHDNVMQKIAMMETGSRPTFLYCDFLKDERRPFEKVEKNKTRMVSGCDLHYTIIFRMYFMKFMRWIMVHRIGNDIAVGCNVYSQDWKLIADKMRAFGHRSIAGDFSNWDGSVQPALLMKTLEIIEAYYSEATIEEKRVRRILWLEVVNSRHVVRGKIYEMVGSVPSGHPMTSIINSICNAIATRYCIVSAQCNGTTDLNLVTKCVSDLRKHTAHIYYGDDNGISVSEAFDNVTMKTLSNSFREVGMVYTDEVKSGAVHDLRDWMECEFLKRSFVMHKNICLCPLRLSVVLEMAYWRTKKSQFMEQHLVAETALQELALHADDVFAKYSVQMIRKMRSLGYSPTFVDKTSLRDAILNSE